MGVIVFAELEQGTQEWLDARSGLPTASEVACLLVDGKGHPDGLGAGAITYAHQVAAEVLAGRALGAVFENEHTRRGHALEEEWLDNYAFMNDVEIERVGFIVNTDIDLGYSPDGLVGKDGCAEVKSPEPHKQIRFLLDPAFPKEYRPQCLGALLVTGREWIDLIIGAEGLPLCVRRLSRSDEGVQAELDKLEKRVKAFKVLVADIVNQVRAFGQAEYEAADKLFAAE